MSLRIPFMSRRVSGRTDMAVPEPGHTPDIPWWVPIFTDWGRPLAAVVVLVLCAPGEQHLAYLAGWNGARTWLSWGWAGLLSLYAGISAVVATVRPRGARGKATAVVGAGLSLLLAMAAQPVSHMFTTGWLSAEPRPPLWLVVSVSGIPPFILGHLLHLAASPVRLSAGHTDMSGTFGQPDRTEPVPAPAPVRPVRSADADSRTVGHGQSDKARDTLSAGHVRVFGQPDKGSVVSPVKPDTPGQSVPSLRDKQSMSARALDLVRLGEDEERIKDALRTEFPDTNRTRQADSIRKAIKRARDKVSRAS